MQFGTEALANMTGHVSYVGMYHPTGAAGEMGPITLASDGNALTGLYLQSQLAGLDRLQEPREQRDNLPIFDAVRTWLDRYFAGEKPGASTTNEFALAPAGTTFRQLVWQVLLEIPYGELVTYGDIARTLEERTGARASARAVGGAVGHNPVSIIIPCHRVVGAGGNLTGYGGGLRYKKWLLGHEGVDMTRVNTPKARDEALMGGADLPRVERAASDTAAAGAVSDETPSCAQRTSSRYFPYGEAEMDYLRGKDAKLGAVIDALGHVDRKMDGDPFSAVCHHIVAQQISNVALATVWGRLLEAAAGLETARGTGTVGARGLTPRRSLHSVPSACRDAA